MLRFIILRLAGSRRLQRRVPRWRFARRAVLRFIPGEDRDAAVGAAARLAEAGQRSIVTFLGENVSDEAAATGVREEYLSALDQIAAATLDSELSVKLTQLGVDVSASVCLANLEGILARAAAGSRFVWIDMESSTYTDVTLEIYERLRGQYPNVGVCLQANLRRTAADLERLLPSASAIRLVKGAYAESGRIAYQRKREIDASFMRLGQRLLHAAAQGNAPLRIAFGTHDAELIARLRVTAQSCQLQRGAYEFQFLFGIMSQLQQRLAAEGERVSVLVNYGSAWYPWFMRRLAERPANLLFLVRSLFG